MLITKTYHDIPSARDNGRPIRIFVIAPTVPGYPNAKFPGTFRPKFTVESMSDYLIMLCNRCRGLQVPSPI